MYNPQAKHPSQAQSHMEIRYDDRNAEESLTSAQHPENPKGWETLAQDLWRGRRRQVRGLIQEAYIIIITAHIQNEMTHHTVYGRPLHHSFNTFVSRTKFRTFVLFIPLIMIPFEQIHTKLPLHQFS